MKHITIMGDSTACGEWDKTQTLLHGGTAQYLRDAGHKVMSVAATGASNKEQTEAVRGTNSDVVIWFLTDPWRDLKNAGLQHQPKTLESYHRRREQLLKTVFNRVSDLPIWLIGGMSAVPEWVSIDHPNWRVITPDMRLWLIPDAEPIDTLARLWKYPDCDEALVDYHQQQEAMLHRHLDKARNDAASGEHRYFWPDGRHANRQAHLKLTQELLLPLL
jgi:hypothetical protein